MGTVVTYPVEVSAYKVSIQRNEAIVELEGIEGNSTRRVGRMTFREGEGREFINRGGFLNITRPLTLFSGALDLLRHDKPITLHGDGTLSTTSEPVGENEE